MGADETRDAWWAAHGGPQAQEPTAEAQKIADDLPPDAQRAITTGPPYALVLTPVIRDQLDLFYLLDDSKAALSDLGVMVWRVYLRWDSDYARREAEYSTWFEHHFRNATRQGHDADNAACFMDPEAHDALIDIAGQSKAVTIAHRDDLRVAEYLEKRGLVLTMPARPGLHVTATQVGRDAALMLRIARRQREKLFEGARRTIEKQETDRAWCQSMETATRVVGGIIDRADTHRRLLALLWIAGQA